jgi:hypothetical protein
LNILSAWAVSAAWSANEVNERIAIRRAVCIIVFMIVRLKHTTAWLATPCSADVWELKKFIYHDYMNPNEPASCSQPDFIQIDTTCARVIRRIASGDWPKTRKKARRIRSR